jgi:RND family efflux transporter MFP subunit
MTMETRMRVGGVLIVCCTVACSRGASSKPPVVHEKPATVENPRTEADLSRVTLSADAVKRLGIETVVARTEAAPSTQTFGGDVIVPEGGSVLVTAPVAGTLTGAPPPAPGAQVHRGDRLMTIEPLMAAERDQRIDAQRAVMSAEAEETAARQRLQRLERLLGEGAASVRGVEEARAQQQIAAATLKAARERLGAISRNPVGEQGELVVSAPLDGIVQRISAMPGQTVAASAALIEIARGDTVWVRVPVYAGDASGIDQSQPVVVSRLGDAASARRATPVVAPLRGDPSTASVELYYALPQSPAPLRLGERVLVELPLKTRERGLALPQASVLYDIHGSTWVYEALGGNTFARRRIEVLRHAGSRVMVGRGIGEGAKVVTTGAPELFGTEFGAGH